jgi:putative DNA primase/helicase
MPTLTRQQIRERIDLIAFLRASGIQVSTSGAGATGMACCPFHADSSPSLSVYVGQAGYQRYKCHGCGTSGDVVDLVMNLEGIGLKDALTRLSAPDVLSAVAHSADSREALAEHDGLEPFAVVPEGVASPFDAGGRCTAWSRRKRGVVTYDPTLTHTYRRADGRLAGYVLRLDFPSTKVAGKMEKVYLTMTWCRFPDGPDSWAAKGWMDKRPIYGAEIAAAMQAEGTLERILLVEGEKAADAGRRMLAGTGICVVAVPGGCKSFHLADWSELPKGVPMHFWPDSDGPGIGGAHQLIAVMATAGRLDSLSILAPMPGVKDGWDIADAEKDPGFSRERLIAYLDEESLDPESFADSHPHSAASAHQPRRIVGTGGSPAALHVAAASKEPVAATPAPAPALPDQVTPSPAATADPVRPAAAPAPAAAAPAVVAGDLPDFEDVAYTDEAAAPALDDVLDLVAAPMASAADPSPVAAPELPPWEGPSMLDDVPQATPAVVNEPGPAETSPAAETAARGLSLAERMQAYADMTSKDLELCCIELIAKAQDGGEHRLFDDDALVAFSMLRRHAKGGPRLFRRLAAIGARFGIDEERLLEAIDAFDTRHGIAGGDLTNEEIEATLGLQLLGFDQKTYYVLSGATGQIIDLRNTELGREASMLMIADRDRWAVCFPDAKNPELPNFSDATAWLMKTCGQRGIFNPDKVRGRGAWTEWDAAADRRRIVLHLGGHLVVDGQSRELGDHKSRFFYPRALEVSPEYHPHPDSYLTPEECAPILRVCQMIRWDSPINPYLLAGWLVTAPVCGAMIWRPHIWITGGAGTGKSWLMDNVIGRLVMADHIARKVQGSTTEAGLRQSLKSDALPILFDEIESEDQTAQGRTTAVLELARMASSSDGGDVIKGSSNQNARNYRIRSMFCLSSIGVSVYQESDRSRFAILHLAPVHKRTEEDEERFRRMNELAAEFDTLYVNRLFSRTVRLLPTIIENARTLSSVCAIVFGSKRVGDQYGTLLAGAYSLTSDELLTREAAREWVEVLAGEIRRSHLSCTENTDHDNLLEVILSRTVRFEAPDGTQHQRIVGDLVADAAGLGGDDALPARIANRALGAYGLRVGDDRLYVANNCHNLGAMLKDTSWARNWNNVLGRTPGAKVEPSAKFFSTALTSRCVSLPLERVVKQDDEDDTIVPFRPRENREAG